MPGYQAVLFDLDGTLLDSSPDFYHIISRMLEEAHRPPIDPMDFRQQVSLGGRAMVSHAFGLPSDSAETEALLAEFLQRYALQPLVHGQLFAGLDRLLLWLDRQRLPWGIVTNKAERFSRPILESLGLAQRCASLICPEQVSCIKPDPEPLLLACKQLGLAPEQALYVGDHQRDVEAGRRAGMRTIACGYGYIPPGEDPGDWQSTHLVQDTQALVELLESLYLHPRA